MLCCIFHVIRVLSVWFTHFNFVNTIVYWDVLYWISEFQNKHIHSRNQYTPSEWVHSKQSFQPSQFSNSLSIHICSITTFTIVIILFFSREEEENAFSSTILNTKQKNKESYFIRSKSFFGTSQIKSQSIILQSYRSISCDSWFHFKCFVFSDWERHWSVVFTPQSLDLPSITQWEIVWIWRIDCGIILLMIVTSMVANRTSRSNRRGPAVVTESRTITLPLSLCSRWGIDRVGMGLAATNARHFWIHWGKWGLRSRGEFLQWSKRFFVR